jgi:hypothetical protein
VTISWVVNAVASTLGSKIAESFTEKLASWQKFAVAMIVCFIGLVVIGIDINLVTIWFYACLGFGRGWSSAMLMPAAQVYTPDDMQTSLISVVKSLCRLVYIPTCFVVNYVGDFNIRYSFWLTLAIFVVPAVVVTVKLKKLERM